MTAHERKTMNDPITITKTQLHDALMTWEEAHRAGETRTYEETRALSAEQVVGESTEYFWALLEKTTEAA